MRALLGFLGRLMCSMDIHCYRYTPIEGSWDRHMLCVRCGDSTYARPYGLGGMRTRDH